MGTSDSKYSSARTSSLESQESGEMEITKTTAISGLEVVLLGQPSTNPIYMEGTHEDQGFQVVSGRKKRQRQRRSSTSRSPDKMIDRSGYSVAMLRRAF